MLRRRSAGIAVAAVMLAAGGAWAQVAPTGRPTRVNVAKVCAAPIERFCPALADGTAQQRNMVICLKPYRTSLPLPCRSAVTAALR